MNRICIVPENRGTGGPASFKRKLKSGLEKRGIEVVHDLDHPHLDAVLVINGTRRLHKLWRCKKRGVRIVHRLGAPNTLHRRMPLGWRISVMAEARNAMMHLIQNRFADHIVYQSRFVQEMWRERRYPSGAGSSIIYNGVELSTFNPGGPRYESKSKIRIISVEGTQGADPYDTAMKLGSELERQGVDFEFLVLGKPWRDMQIRMSKPGFMNFIGFVPNDRLPFYYRGSDLFVSIDTIAGCPNSVLESLACGTPVLGYDAGPLPEMMTPDAGRCVECIGDPLKGQSPENIKTMARAALEIVEHREAYGGGARRLAEKRYDVDDMVEAYIAALSG